MAVIVFFLVAIAVTIALKNVTKVVRGNDAKEVPYRVAVAVACAAGDPCEINSNMNAGIAE